MKRPVIKTVSLLLLLVFFADTCCYGLATHPASQNPLIKREILAALNRTQIRYAESEDAVKLLKANNASCLLLSSGKYLVTKEVAQNDATLLRAIIHEDIEAIMQILIEEGRRNKNSKYQGIKELILKDFPPPEGSDALEAELYVNDTVAKAFEWLIPVADGLITENEIPGEVRDFISTIEPIIKANKHNYFNGEFWDLRIRGERIRIARNSGMGFYQVANNAVEGIENNLKRYPVDKGLDILKVLIAKKIEEKGGVPVTVMIDGASGVGKTQLSSQIFDREGEVVIINRDSYTYTNTDENDAKYTAIDYDRIYSDIKAILRKKNIKLIVFEGYRAYDVNYNFDIRVKIESNASGAGYRGSETKEDDYYDLIFDNRPAFRLPLSEQIDLLDKFRPYNKKAMRFYEVFTKASAADPHSKKKYSELVENLIYINTFLRPCDRQKQQALFIIKMALNPGIKIDIAIRNLLIDEAIKAASLITDGEEESDTLIDLASELVKHDEFIEKAKKVFDEAVSAARLRDYRYPEPKVRQLVKIALKMAESREFIDDAIILVNSLESYKEDLMGMPWRTVNPRDSAFERMAPVIAAHEGLTDKAIKIAGLISDDKARLRTLAVVNSISKPDTGKSAIDDAFLDEALAKRKIGKIVDEETVNRVFLANSQDLHYLLPVVLSMAKNEELVSKAKQILEQMIRLVDLMRFCNGKLDYICAIANAMAKHESFRSRSEEVYIRAIAIVLEELEGFGRQVPVDYYLSIIIGSMARSQHLIRKIDSITSSLVNFTGKEEYKNILGKAIQSAHNEIVLDIIDSIEHALANDSKYAEEIALGITRDYTGIASHALLGDINASSSVSNPNRICIATTAGREKALRKLHSINRIKQKDKDAFKALLHPGSQATEGMWKDDLICRIFPFVYLLSEEDEKHARGVVGFVETILNGNYNGFMMNKEGDGYKEITPAMIKRYTERAERFINRRGNVERRRELIYLAAILHDLGKAMDKTDHNEIGAMIVPDVFSMLNSNDFGYSEEEIELVRLAVKMHDFLGNLFYRERIPKWLLDNMPKEQEQIEDVLDLMAIITLCDGREGGGKFLIKEKVIFYDEKCDIDNLQSDAIKGLWIRRIKDMVAQTDDGKRCPEADRNEDEVDDILDKLKISDLGTYDMLKEYLGEKIQVFVYGKYILNTLGRDFSRENLVKFYILIARICKEKLGKNAEAITCALDYDRSVNRIKEKLSGYVKPLNDYLSGVTIQSISSDDIYKLPIKGESDGNKVKIDLRGVCEAPVGQPGAHEISAIQNYVNGKAISDITDYDTVPDQYDAQSATVLLTDLLYDQLHEDRFYEIKYDTSRLTVSQIEIVEEYVRLLQLRSSNPNSIKLRPFSSAQGSKESLIAVYCTGKDFKGEGHVDVTIPDGELKEYLLRVAGMVNIALASSSIPDNLSREEVDKYRPIMSYIKNQYKTILGEELAIPDNPEDILKVIRRIVLGLPKSLRMNTDQIEEFNRLAKTALTAA